MNYKKLPDWNSGFHDWIIRRHPHEGKKQNGFMGGFIKGKRGNGKSTYCYKLGGKVYYTMNGFNKKDDEEEAFKECLKYMVFDPQDLRKLLIANKVKNIITPFVCVDDASMHFGNTLHQTNPLLYAALRAETATIRTAITGFVINAPKVSHVAKCLRDYDDYVGQAVIDKGGENNDPTQPRTNWNRKIRFYQWVMYPDEKNFNIKIPFQDKYSCYIPEPFYSWYTTKKNYFEIKYEIDLADKIDKATRELIIALKDDLPSYPGQPNLKDVITRWEKEVAEKKSWSKIEKIQQAMKNEKIFKKINEYKENRIKKEKMGNA